VGGKIRVLKITYKFMDEKEIEILAQKIKDGKSTPEEELSLLKFLNQGVEEMRSFIKQIMPENK
jgi:hypothetical protein